jgi:hypothetical protein
MVNTSTRTGFGAGPGIPSGWAAAVYNPSDTSDATFAYASEQCTITVPNFTSGQQYARVYFNTADTLDSQSVRVDVSGSIGDDIRFHFDRGGGTWFFIRYNAADATLHGGYANGGPDNDAFSIAYNATDHAYWRIENSAGDVLLRTSPDGTTWTTRGTLTAAYAGATGNVLCGVIQSTTGAGSRIAKFSYINAVAGGGASPVPIIKAAMRRRHF